MALIFFMLLSLTGGLTQEVTTSSSLLGPRNFNHHPFASNYLQGLETPATTKKGPVLFPNDAPPPPRPPLIVTSRPLLESIARSELNPSPQNNTIPLSSQVNNVIRPFLARVKEYRPFGYVATPAPVYDYVSYDRSANRGREYEDYTQKAVLPPIYKVIADHVKQKVAKTKQERDENRYEYQVQKEPKYYSQYNPRQKNSDDNDGNEDEGKNYAFSYRVKDRETGDDFSHTQQSSGSATNGEYRVRLPDGRMQIVSYTADENGYHADVRYADDVVKSTNNDVNHRNDHNEYNGNYFNDNHNTIDSSHSNLNGNLNRVNHYDDFNHNQYNDKYVFKNDYLQQRDYKINDDINYKNPVSNDYYNQYSDNSKEYYNDDISKEFESKSYDYAPHKSKYTSFIPTQSTYVVPKVNFVASSTVKPSYEELKDLLITKDAYNTVQPYHSKIPVTISVPSTTPSTFEGTTERVVLIGGKKSSFYTNVNNVPLVSTPQGPVTPLPVKYVTSGDFGLSPTPMSYLASTISNLRNKVDLSGPKPVLSNSYIDRINKYLRFN